MNNREAFESWYKKVNCGFDDFSRHELGYYDDFDVRRDWDVWQAALASQAAELPSNPLQLNTDSAREYLVENLLPKFSDSTFAYYVRNELAGDFAYQLATYLQSQTQQPTNLVTRKAFICPACEGVDADLPVSQCHCMENDSNTFIEGTITYSKPSATEGEKE